MSARGLLVAAILCNVALLDLIHGTIGWVGVKRLWARPTPAMLSGPQGAARAAMFASMPTSTAGPIVFLGDSITANYEWREAFPGLPVLNRGIASDTAEGVLARVGEITRLRPSAVFLMIGTNDAPLRSHAAADTLRAYSAILQAIRRESPDTKVYAQSILPTKDATINSANAEVNRGIRECADGQAVVFIDLWPAFAKNGAISPELTYDGTHLTAAGYRLWLDKLAPLI